ncbi:hypothetical protein, partial [Haloarcula sp. Atlit-120R]|uniref:hypothetical protein n=1 Tax=Haloarcula sp. Atlit-120R TaxID=2282135 RepID=UPI000FF1B00B
LDEYAEVYDLTRTEAMTLILERGLEDPPEAGQVEADSRYGGTRTVYTLSLNPANAESVEESELSAEEYVNQCINVAHARGFAP